MTKSWTVPSMISPKPCTYTDAAPWRMLRMPKASEA